jgi:predicted acetyltransferase
VFCGAEKSGVFMLISIRDCKYSKKDRHWIEYVYSEYVDSLADLNTGVYRLLNPENPQQDEIFANWFANEHSHPLVILRGPDPVGFALVTRPRVASSGGTLADYNMAEFFVRKQYRRSGAGRSAAALIFDRFAGEWEILQYQRNPGAVMFWRKVVADYSRGNFTEKTSNGETRHRFRSRPQVRQEN